jgi:hypothetical protein
MFIRRQAEEDVSLATIIDGQGVTFLAVISSLATKDHNHNQSESLVLLLLLLIPIHFLFSFRCSPWRQREWAAILC